jgi:hypothetical protein
VLDASPRESDYLIGSWPATFPPYSRNVALGRNFFGDAHRTHLSSPWPFDTTKIATGLRTGLVVLQKFSPGTVLPSGAAVAVVLQK